MCEQLTLTASHPLESWLANPNPRTSGYAFLAGNATAHAPALECRLLDAAAHGRSELLEAAGRAHWYTFSCDDGCASLVDDVGRTLRDRATGRWSVVLVQEAEHAPVSAINTLVSRFWQQAKCQHRLAEGMMEADCSRTLFVLSSRFGSELLSSADALAKPRVKLQADVLRGATAWLNRHDSLSKVPQRLKNALALAMGERPGDLFAHRMAEQDAQRQQRCDAEKHGGGAGAGAGAGAGSGGALVVAGAAAAAAAGASASAAPQVDLSVFERMAGNEQVVAAVRERLRNLRSGADGGEAAHTFFFYGYPGTGKSFLAELMGRAVHGAERGNAPPFYEKFASGNYKTKEDTWTLTSPPCGVESEGAFVPLFAGRTASDALGGKPGPVVVFDEIEEAGANFMTDTLVHAIDAKGWVEIRVKSSSSGSSSGNRDGRSRDADGAGDAPQCSTQSPSTAGAFFVLTSNCFLDDLRGVHARHRQLPPDEAYAATRREMDRRIFDEKIACDADGRASPFHAEKMRDRMRGNLYPFLPLSDEHTRAAFALQLQQRATTYATHQNVSLYWSADFVRHWADKAADGSLRNALDAMMRGDERSIERLYTAGHEACAARRVAMRKLVLHIRAAEPHAKEYCDSDARDGDGADADALALPSPSLAAGGGGGGGVGASAASAGLAAAPAPPPPPGGGGGGRRVQLATATAAAVEVAPDAAAASLRRADLRREVQSEIMAEIKAEVEATRARELSALRATLAAYETQLDEMRDVVTALRAELLHWKLLCAALVVVTALLGVGLAHVAVAAFVSTAKVVAYAACAAVALAAVAATALLLACSAGWQTGCVLLDAVVVAARWVAWAAVQAWWMLSQLLGDLGPALVAAVAAAVLLLGLAARRTARRKRRAEEAHAVRHAAALAAARAELAAEQHDAAARERALLAEIARMEEAATRRAADDATVGAGEAEEEAREPGRGGPDQAENVTSDATVCTTDKQDGATGRALDWGR